MLEFDGPLMASLIYSRKLAPLEGLVAPETIDNQTVSVQAQNTYIGDDQLYALSMFDSGLGIYGNRRLLEEAGVRIPTGLDDAWSAEEFDEVLAQLAEADPDGKPLDIKENYGAAYSSYAFLPIVNSTGIEVVVDNRAEGNLNSPPVVDVLEQFASWRPLRRPRTPTTPRSSRDAPRSPGSGTGCTARTPRRSATTCRASAPGLRGRPEERSGVAGVGHRRADRQGVRPPRRSSTT